jgi:SAM-dependent methyltransferase
MLLADPGAALGETRRVLRPDGRLAFAVWHAPDRNPWASAPAAALVGRGVVGAWRTRAANGRRRAGGGDRGR